MMLRGIEMKNDLEEKENPLNNDNSGDDLKINRGVELLLRNKRRKIQKPKTFQVRFGKIFSFFNREIDVYFNFSLDFRRKN